MTTIELPEYVKKTVTKSVEVTKYVIGGVQYRPGKSIMLIEGDRLLGFGPKGKYEFTISGGQVIFS